jgi:hypothetical protein
MTFQVKNPGENLFMVILKQRTKEVVDKIHERVHRCQQDIVSDVREASGASSISLLPCRKRLGGRGGGCSSVPTFSSNNSLLFVRLRLFGFFINLVINLTILPFLPLLVIPHLIRIIKYFLTEIMKVCMTFQVKNPGENLFIVVNV